MKITKGSARKLGHCSNCNRYNPEDDTYKTIYEIELGDEKGHCFITFRLCEKCFFDLRDEMRLER